MEGVFVGIFVGAGVVFVGAGTAIGNPVTGWIGSCAVWVEWVGWIGRSCR